MFKHTTRKTYTGPNGVFDFIHGQFDKFDKFFDKMDELFEEIDESINDDFGPKVIIEVGSSGGSCTGALVSIELPGVPKESVFVKTQGQIITIAVEHEFTGFVKTFRVDTKIFDLNTLKASYKDGLLTLTLSRREGPDVEDKRTIPIE